MRDQIGFTRRVLALSLCAAFARPVIAHHTFAMFDGRQKLSLQGSVKELQWTNPHCFLQLLVPKNGTTQEWSLQMNAPLDLYRGGWRPHSLKAGDKVSVIVHPSRDGRPSGQFVSGTGPDGQALAPG